MYFLTLLKLILTDAQINSVSYSGETGVTNNGIRGTWLIGN